MYVKNIALTDAVRSSDKTPANNTVFFIMSARYIGHYR